MQDTISTNKTGKSSKIVFNCEVCGKSTERRKKDYVRAKNHFCSPLCSETFIRNNKKTNTPFRECLLCGKTVEARSRKFCIQCQKTKKKERLETIRKNSKKNGKCLECQKSIVGVYGRCKDCRNAYNATVKISDLVYSNSNKYSYIRKMAEYIIVDNNISRVCRACGYSKVTEICHIKAISDFDPESLVMDVNDINNLTILCPNCHACFDRIPEEREKILNKIQLA